MLHHELWRDEAQVWCLVRDLDLISLIKSIMNEGHPFLWYLLNLPFAKLGFPVLTMQIIGLFFVFIAILIVIFKSPFNKFMKTLIIFNSGMLYLIPIIVRNYSLIPFFLFLIALIYNDRQKKPYLYLFLLFCLSQTHSLMLCTSVTLLFFFTLERIKIFKKVKKSLVFSIIISYLNLIFLTLCYWFNLKNNIVITETAEYYKTLPNNFLINNFVHCFFPREIINTYYNFTIYSPYIVYTTFIIIILFLFMINKKSCIIFSLTFFYIFSIFIYIYSGGIPLQKLFLIILCLIFALWVVNETKYKNLKKTVEVILTFYLILFLSYTPYFIKNEYTSNFSNGKIIANYIKENLKNENIILYKGHPALISPISTYLPNINIYSYDDKKFISYYNFSNKTKNRNLLFPQNTKYIIIQYHFYINSDPLFVAEDLFYTDVNIHENFSIFKYNQNEQIIKKNL